MLEVFQFRIPLEARNPDAGLASLPLSPNVKAAFLL
jgi:hypothetical protein